MAAAPADPAARRGPTMGAAARPGKPRALDRKLPRPDLDRIHPPQPAPHPGRCRESGPLRALHQGEVGPEVHRMIERQTVPLHDDTPPVVHYPKIPAGSEPRLPGSASSRLTGGRVAGGPIAGRTSAGAFGFILPAILRGPGQRPGRPPASRSDVLAGVHLDLGAGDVGRRRPSTGTRSHRPPRTAGPAGATAASRRSSSVPGDRIAVSTSPGAMALTRTPSGPKSCAISRVSAFSAAFEVA